MKFKERSRKVFKAAAIPVAILAGGAMVMGGSSAAFSGLHATPDSNWKAATLTLSSSTASALFNATMKPGDVKNRCITVTSGADVPVDLKLYASGAVGNGMNDNLDVRVSAVTGGTDNGTDCTGYVEGSGPIYNDTMAKLLTDHSNWATGLAGGGMAPGAAKQFLIRTTLKAGAPNSLQGTATNTSFLFEIQ